MSKKLKVVFGILGTVLDAGKGSARWNRWRPTVSLFQHEDLLIDRFELIHDGSTQGLEKRVAEDIHQISPETQTNCQLIPLKDPWDFEEVYGAFYEFLKLYPFNLDEEEYLVHITTGTHVAQICLFLLVEAHYLPGKIIQSSPGQQKQNKSLGRYTIVDLDLSQYDRIVSRFKQERFEATSFLKSGIETKNKKFNELISQIEEVASVSKAPILLMGPTGAGKSQLARKIFDLKEKRRQVKGAFVEINCATLRGDALMSALFGHVKGAFTGAIQDRKGLLKKANQGVLFLDEIGELGLDEQAMLLRAIEERVFLPLGADQEVRSDFQLIAGTNQDLYQKVSAGQFREDLLARIDLWSFQLPALKDRREDIEPNITYEFERYEKQHQVSIRFSREAKHAFLKFALSAQATWKRNFRDLNAAINRMATLAHFGRIDLKGVKAEIQRLKRSWKSGQLQEGLLKELLGPQKFEALDHFDRCQLDEVVKICRTSKSLSQAGRRLFNQSRLQKKSTNDADRLKKYLARYGLSWDSTTDL